MNEGQDSKRMGIGAGATLFLGVSGLALGMFIVAALIDIQMASLSWDTLIEAAKSGGLQSSMGSLAEVLAAVLGISLTVVAIVVQLAAQRYPAKIVDVFMVDPINIAVFAFMASSCIFVVVVPAFTVATPAPVFMPMVAIGLTVMNFALLLPYFGHVFAFLEPTNLISEIEGRARTALEGVASGRTNDASMKAAQDRVATALDRIADNCMAAVQQSDRNLALHSLRTIEEFLIFYLDKKSKLPKQWGNVPPTVFGTLAQEFANEIVDNFTWLEAKGFMEFERIFRRSVGEMNEVVSQLGRSTRNVGEHACKANESEVLELTVRFFNTYLRHGLNSRNVRAVYNTLYEYRRLALCVLEHDPAVARRIVEHLVYYGRTANEMGLPFVTVTVAHDVRVICQRAHRDARIDLAHLLNQFLTLDQQVEGKSQEVALIGVRKAQSILGAYFLEQGITDMTNQIRADMAHEDPRRLETIRDGILAIEEKKFWEITDRGMNFDYVEPELRPFVSKFFEPLLDRDAQLGL